MSRFTPTPWAALLLALGAPLAGQQPPPTGRVVTIDSLVVIAERAATTLSSSTAAVSVLTAEQLARVPHVTLADALRQVPGFAVVGFDGLGYDPQLMVRGFYGGGQAEYVVVMVDGQPLNDLPGGRVPWDAIPLERVERVEIVRGGASPLWGDAALGGVINVITRPPEAGALGWSLTGGSHGTQRGSGDAHTRIAGRDLALSGGFDRTDGYRAHAERSADRAGATLALAAGPAGSLELRASTHWRRFDEPGPLLGAAAELDPTASDIFFRFDETDERSYRVGLDGSRMLGERARLSGSLLGELRHVDAVRTLALTPDFADTQERDLGTTRALATTQLAIENTGLAVADRLIVGVDASFGTLDSEYRVILRGDRSAYQGAAGGGGELDAAGSGERSAAAAFVQYALQPLAAVRVSLGVRADWLRDAYEARAPEPGQGIDATHAALSPRVGVNVAYLDTDTRSGHLYASAGRSFKAPTLDQLFDQRRLPVPFPPFAITTSNALLEPQHGTSLEVGVYHAVSRPGGVHAELSVAAYQMDMEDELDFSIQELRYVNIGRSRHRGVEAGLTLQSSGTGTLSFNYTRQDVTARAGEHAGRALKAIPGHFLSGGLGTAPFGELEVGLLVSHARDIWLDDANTLRLPAYTRVDARASHPLAGMRLFLDVRNVLDATYSTTGFPDPSGSGAVYYHPAAGRTVDLGVRGGS